MKIKLVTSKNQLCCLSNMFEDIPDLEDDVYEWYEQYLHLEDAGMDEVVKEVQISDLCRLVNKYCAYSGTWVYWRDNSRRIQLKYKNGAALDTYVLIIYLKEE